LTTAKTADKLLTIWLRPAARHGLFSGMPDISSQYFKEEEW
jgi:hypothetical protein